ncbi:MAG: hypothetical protein RLY71_3292 [Pseudomonadota bacterium]|jgi:hypothetical protein
MDAIIKKLFQELPTLFSDTFKVIWSPRKLVAQILEPKAEAYTPSRAGAYLISVTVLCIVLQQLFPASLALYGDNANQLLKDNNFIVQSIAELCVVLSWLGLSTITSLKAWQVFGGRAIEFQQCLEMSTYAIATLILATTFLQGIASFVTFDPVIARTNSRLEQLGKQMLPELSKQLCIEVDAASAGNSSATNTQLQVKLQAQMQEMAGLLDTITKRTFYKMMGWVQTVAGLVLAISLLRYWLSFGSAIGASGISSLLNVGVALVTALLVTGISELVKAKIKLQFLISAC